ncbi:MAG TPA: 3'-5' exonuclease [Cyclobacteriaceae bacterium]|nr:3'-5' exonuclease [Cyclobacteriaceae bacterium]
MAWFGFLKKEVIPPTSFVTEYENLFKNKIPKHTPVSELVFTVLDTETTGLNPKTNEIVSYGAIQVRGNRILVNSVQEYYLKPSKQNKEAVKIHGIIRHDGFADPSVFVKQFLEQLANTILVAHHAGFDKAMLEKAGKTFGLKKILNPTIDTFDLAVRLENGKNYNPRMINGLDYSLDKLCERYHIPLDDRHTASGDAFLTAQLLLKLLTIAHRAGIRTYGDLLGK